MRRAASAATTALTADIRIGKQRLTLQIERFDAIIASMIVSLPTSRCRQIGDRRTADSARADQRDMRRLQLRLAPRRRTAAG